MGNSGLHPALRLTGCGVGWLCPVTPPTATYKVWIRAGGLGLAQSKCSGVRATVVSDGLVSSSVWLTLWTDDATDEVDQPG